MSHEELQSLMTRARRSLCGLALRKESARRLPEEDCRQAGGGRRKAIVFAGSGDFTNIQKE
jgi:hypothetical protein